MVPVHPDILVLGYSEAGMLVRKGVASLGALITIHGQREYPIEVPGLSAHLGLEFDDTVAPSPTDPIQAASVRMRHRQAAEIGLNLRPPTVEDAASIIEFAGAIRDTQGSLLCQCQAGISRSPAAALLCLATWTEPGQESHCVQHLLSVRPSAVPHSDLVAFGDTVLGRGGLLCDALAIAIAHRRR
jgi:predicted protein tyrosine phosphatase